MLLETINDGNHCNLAASTSINLSTCSASTSSSPSPPSLPSPSTVSTSYDFETEWRSACLLRAASGHVSQCSGIRDPAVSSLFAMAGPGGQASQHDLASGVFPVLSIIWGREGSGCTPEAFCKRHGVFSYISDAECIRSAFCSYETGCTACAALAATKSLRQRAQRAQQASQLPIDVQSASTRQKATADMSIKEMHLLTTDLRETCYDLTRQQAQATLSKTRIVNRVEKLAKFRRELQEQDLNKVSGSKLCKLVEEATTDGKDGEYTHSYITN